MKISTISHRNVVTVPRHTTVTEAARTMRQTHVGDVIVAEGGKPVGIVTDRDIVTEVLGRGYHADEIEVDAIMTRSLVALGADDEVDHALAVMSDKGVRRAPVVDGEGRLQGVVSMDELVGVIAAEVARLVRLIRREHAQEQSKMETRSARSSLLSGER